MKTTVCSMIDISVITITKNDLVGLELTIKSINQSILGEIKKFNVEHLIVVNNQDLPTIRHLEEMAYRPVVGNSRKIIMQSGKGIGNAFNVGLQAASGKVVTFLNSGDIYTQSFKLYSAYQSFLSDGWDWAYGGVISVSRSKILLGRRRAKEINLSAFLFGNPINHQSAFYSSDLIRDVGSYSESIGALDFEYNIRCMLKSIVFPLPFYVCEFDVTGLSSTAVFSSEKSHNQVRYKYLRHSRLFYFWFLINYVKAALRYLYIPLKRL